MLHRTPVRRRLLHVVFASLLAFLAAILTATGTQAVATPAQAGSDAAAQQLADRYAPFVIIREQLEVCGPGEPYLPTSVDSVLNDPQVVLRGPDDQVIATAPTAADLAGLGEGYYLDYPGNPLDPGCEYEKWFDAKDAPATVYAHVATDPAYPDDLVLQYWLFWVFNDWNDRHEGDWEMVQIRFPVPTVEQALQTQPTSVAFAQHEGSEVSAWDDPKLRRDGDHIAVYPGQGSHAAYFTQETWFGKSAAAGFGCDNTTGPSERVEPRVVLLPEDPAEYPAWLTFTGRWGQKEASFNNGPTGPNTKTQWTQPVDWQVTEGRPSAVSIPASGGIATDAFCSLTRSGSLLFIALLDRPWAVIGAIVVLLVGLVWAIKSTTWRLPELHPLTQVRGAGQVAHAGLRWWRQRWRFTAPIGVAILALTFVAVTIQQLAAAPRPVAGSLTQLEFPAGGWAPVIVVVTSLLLFAGLTFLYSAMVRAVVDDDLGQQPRFAAVLAATWKSPLPWAVLALSLFVGGFLLASLVFAVVLVFLVGRWAVASPAATSDEQTFTGAFGRSNQLSAGHRWHVIGAMAILAVLVVVPAGLVGAVLLLVTSWPFWITGLLTTAVSAALVTAAFAGLALLMLDLRARAAVNPDGTD